MTSCSGNFMIFVHDDDLIHQAADSDSVRNNQHGFILQLFQDFSHCLCLVGWVKIRGRLHPAHRIPRPYANNDIMLRAAIVRQTAPARHILFRGTSFPAKNSPGAHCLHRQSQCSPQPSGSIAQTRAASRKYCCSRSLAPRSPKLCRS